MRYRISSIRNNMQLASKTTIIMNNKAVDLDLATCNFKSPQYTIRKVNDNF